MRVGLAELGELHRKVDAQVTTGLNLFQDIVDVVQGQITVQLAGYVHDKVNDLLFVFLSPNKAWQDFLIEGFSADQSLLLNPHFVAEHP